MELHGGPVLSVGWRRFKGFLCIGSGLFGATTMVTGCGLEAAMKRELERSSVNGTGVEPMTLYRRISIILSEVLGVLLFDISLD